MSVPMMKVKVTTPERYLGGVMDDLALWQGHVIAVKPHRWRKRTTIDAFLPASAAAEYTKRLRYITDGKAKCRVSSAEVAGDDEGTSAGKPAPLKPVEPTLSATVALEPPRPEPDL